MVTGGSGGIGMAIAARLADRGARLVVIARDESRMRRAADAWRQSTVPPLLLAADLREEDQVARAADRVIRDVGSVHVLVHCAGAITLGGFGELPLAALDEQYQVNVRAPFQLTQLLLPALKAVRGQIVFVNSSAGLAARAGVSQYGATKHAQKALADSLREEVHSAGVRVLSVFPGRTATPMQERVRRMEGRPYDPVACLQPEDVASVVMAALEMPRSAEVKDISIRPMCEGA